MVVGAQYLRHVPVDDNGAIHLRELEEAIGRKRDVELEAIVTGPDDVIRITDADEGTEVASDDHVERMA